MRLMFNGARAFSQDITGWSCPSAGRNGWYNNDMFAGANAWLAKYKRIAEKHTGLGRYAGPPWRWELQTSSTTA